ncbi:MAG: urea ABC transporter permease subunit UrtB, partial [Pseudomonadota bacterium]
MLRILIAAVMMIITTIAALAQSADLQSILQENQKAVERASRNTISPILEALINSGSDQVPVLLEKWQNKELWMRKEDGLFFFVEDAKADPIQLIDITSGEPAETATKRDLKQLKPNSGVRSVMASTLVRFQLIDENENRRMAALSAIERDPDDSHLQVLREVVEREPVATIKSRMQRLERLLTIRFDGDIDARVEAINGFAGDTNR